MLEARSAEASLEAKSAEGHALAALTRRNFVASRLHHLSRFARLVDCFLHVNSKASVFKFEVPKMSVGTRHVITFLLNVKSQVVGKNKFSFCLW